VQNNWDIKILQILPGHTYATSNELRADLFGKIGNAVPNRGDFLSFNIQNLANIAWASVANADSPMIFIDDFTNALLERQQGFEQWQSAPSVASLAE
jgi:hypothetical protein